MGHNQFANHGMGNAIFGGKVAQKLVSPHAQPGPYRAWGIIHTRMDDFGITGADTAADGFFGFQNDHFPACSGNFLGNGQTDNARPNDHAFNPFHPSWLRLFGCFLKARFVSVEQFMVWGARKEG
jgi:hypothetical protein